MFRFYCWVFINLELNFRKLTADEIEARVATVSEKGCTVLLYKNARCDMNILDECVGPMNWQRDHKELKGNMYSGLGIYDEEKKLWIWKWDCGTESNTEAEKGEEVTENAGRSIDLPQKRRRADCRL